MCPSTGVRCTETAAVTPFPSPGCSLQRSFHSFLLQIAEKDGAGGPRPPRPPSGLAAVLSLQRPAPHSRCGPGFLPRDPGLTWRPTVFLCSLLAAFSWGLAERTWIFEDEPFADAVEAGTESLSSWNRSATSGN